MKMKYIIFLLLLYLVLLILDLANNWLVFIPGIGSVIDYASEAVIEVISGIIVLIFAFKSENK